MGPAPPVLVVDAANVVGSRPDGWWRDRAGAAGRLRDELAPLVSDGLTSLPDGVAGTPAPEPEPGAAAPPPRPAPAPIRSWNPYAGSGWRRREEETGMGDGEITLRWYPDVILVVEGAARPAARDDGARQKGASQKGAGQSGASQSGTSQNDAGPNGAGHRTGQLRVVAAEGEGDDTIAALAGQTGGRRVVVTADRELRRRCEDAGASVAGPGWLLGQL